MTTASDAVMSAIDTNWNVGTGGTKPVLYNKENIGQDWPPDDDWVMVKNWEYEKRRKRRNDSYVGEKDYVGLRVHSKNDANLEERLDTIVTEIYRVVTPTNVTGYHTVDIVHQTRRASDKRTKRYIADLTVELIIKSTDAAAVPGSVASTATIDALLMYGSANAAWVPMTLAAGSYGDRFKIIAGLIKNVGGADGELAFMLPTPCVKGTLKLYLKSAKYGVVVADATDYIHRVKLFGWNGNTITQIDVDNTDHTSAGDKTFAGAVMPASAIDVSSYQSIMLFIEVVVTTADEFQLINARMECYYAA